MNRGKRLAAVLLSCLLAVGMVGQACIAPAAIAEGTAVVAGRFSQFT